MVTRTLKSGCIRVPLEPFIGHRRHAQPQAPGLLGALCCRHGAVRVAHVGVRAVSEHAGYVGGADLLRIERAGQQVYSLSDSTQPKRIVGKPFQPGNPGRPKGSRNKLQEDFVRDFCAVWSEKGYEALLDVAQNDKATFVKVAASILPKEIKAEIEHRAVMRMPAVHETPDEWIKASLPSSGSPPPARKSH